MAGEYLEVALWLVLVQVSHQPTLPIIDTNLFVIEITFKINMNYNYFRRYVLINFLLFTLCLFKIAIATRVCPGFVQTSKTYFEIALLVVETQ